MCYIRIGTQTNAGLLSSIVDYEIVYQCWTITFQVTFELKRFVLLMVPGL